MLWENRLCVTRRRTAITDITIKTQVLDLPNDFDNSTEHRVTIVRANVKWLWQA